ncbi:hypothetical protein O3P69_007885 [Scylla paramamosain]|uniref:Uncharacterized protein n=1 Tax=Scylla paramamosain TaxID=85552 RepID=A0AAW0SFT0_SCYPA
MFLSRWLRGSVNDSRTTENFINSSTFLTNNNASKKISINETKNERIRQACWNSGDSGGGGELNTLEYNTDNVDIENDPVFFYRFVAYTLGMLANNDQFFEDLTGIITESFDFNGVDTRNWNDFIEKPFLSVMLGRRAFGIENLCFHQTHGRQQQQQEQF